MPWNYRETLALMKALDPVDAVRQVKLSNTAKGQDGTYRSGIPYITARKEALNL